MNEKAAKGIAANIRIIVENTARIVTISATVPGYSEARAIYQKAIDKAEAAIAEWLMQPMTFKA